MAETTTTHLTHCIARLNAGDASARDELIQRACERLKRLTYRIMADFRRVQRWEDADDVFQGASVRLLKALQAVPLTTTEEFFRLAAVQIRRELHDLVRKHFGPEGDGANLATDAPMSTGQRGAAQSTYDPGKLAFWTEFHQRVEALPADERMVFDLLWYQGLTQEEASQVLGLSVPTIKRRWAAARMRLGEMIQ